MALQRYDVEFLERPGTWTERYWSPVNAAVLVHRVEEVTELLKARGGPDGSRARVLEAELYTRARELREVNERLRQTHARERETGSGSPSVTSSATASGRTVSWACSAVL